MAGLQPNQLIDSRRGVVGSDPFGQAALQLARKVLTTRGEVSDADLSAARSAGLNDAQIAEVIAHVALNIFTNYFNRVAHTEVDFPKVPLAL
jgi:alkylhydroperoxidase family enzyme